MNSITETESSTTNSLPPIGYIPSLDGLRAVAVILVLLSHANFQLGDNGVLGVDIFFALSGFLITTLLLEEYQRKNKITISAFYIRRTFRLFPALYTMLLFVLIYAILFRKGEDLSSILGELISSALYLYNISWLWGWGDKGLLLGHTWSLAVEEQFYLLWPCFLILSLSFKFLKQLTVALTILIVIAFNLKIFGHMSSIGNSLIHEAIYIGCLAALIRWIFGNKIRIPDYFALIFITFIIVVGVLPIKFYYVIYNAGGRSIMALAASIVIISLVSNQKGLTSKLLSLSPIVWIGKISYALYLWHVPVFKILNYHSTLPPSVTFILKFVITFILSVISWIFIEKKTTDFGRSLSKRLVNKKSK